MQTEPGKEKRSLPEQFRETWSQALAAVSNAEEEAQKALARVSDLAGWGPEEVRRHARELADRLAGQRRELEKNIETGVNKALSRIKLPRRQEVSRLQERVAAVSSRIDALLRKGGK
jgi:polyhydroxyalkanoate synthesis regulator phasin